MDKCEICGKDIENGIQYVVSTRQIRFGEKDWFATDHKHYSFCEMCNQTLQLYIKWARSSEKI